MRISQLALSAVLCVSRFASSVLAIQASEAGVVDWHKPHLGLPLVGSEATAPVFHQFEGEDALILLATRSNVLGALDPGTGEIAWRYLFDDSDPIQLFKASGSVVAALSGPGGAYFRTFDARTGWLLTETRLHESDAGRLLEPSNVGLDIYFDHTSGGRLVLSDGHALTRLNAQGEVVWTWSSADEGSLTMYNKIHMSGNTVYLLGLSKSTASNTLTITSFDSSSGAVIASSHFASSITSGPVDSFIVLDSLVLWLEKQGIQSLDLTPELKAKPTNRRKSSTYHSLRKLGAELDALVAVKEDGSAVVLSLQDGKVLEVPESQLLPESGFSGLTSSLTRSDMLLFTWARSEKTMFAKVASPKLATGTDRQGTVTFDFPYDHHLQGSPAHVTFDYNTHPRMLITTGVGTLQLWEKDTLVWAREESLSDIALIEFVELPEAKVALSQVHGGLTDDDDEGFTHRLLRQVADAKNFPSYAAQFAKRFATGSHDLGSDLPSFSANSDTTTLTRDEFGFRQLIVVASKTGKLFGLDSRDGSIVWSRTLGISWAGQGKQIGATVHPLKMFVTKTVNDGEGDRVGHAEVVLIAQMNANNGLSQTFAYKFDPLTGGDTFEASLAGDALQGVEVVEAPVLETFLIPGSDKTIAVVDQYLQIHLFPSTPETTSAFAEIASTLHFTLRTGTPGSHRLAGHQVLPIIEDNQNFMSYATWTVTFAPGEDIQAVIPRSHPDEPTASLGRVLGDRRTLYKYLNPHLFVVLTAATRYATSGSPATVTCGVYALEGVKGSIVYEARLPSVHGKCDVKAELVENWLVYSYYDAGPTTAPGGDKSHRVVSVELYEGQKPDDVTRSSEGTAYKNTTTDIMILEQSFIAPAKITALGATATKFGITSKDIVFANERKQIQSMPRRALDPRRPKNKPTKDELEEMLIQYEPLLPDDHRRVISHTCQVAKIEHIVTAPALLESSSLIFAHGLDLFLTRVAPSGTFDVLSENFNKVQLLLTITGLVVAITITKPMVRRKRLREKWYDS